MLAKRVIACLDVKDGRVVKGTNFVGLKDAGDPAELALRYAREGADEIVFLDISASNENRGTNREWVRKTARELDVPFTVGGGIRSANDVRETLSCGADKIALNTAALARPELVSEAAGEYGSQCVVVAIDAKRNGSEWGAYANGGTRATGRDALAWAQECERLGAGEILLTSIDCDGTRQGFDCELLSKASSKLGIPLIASGGAGNASDFLDAFTAGADAALAAGVFHYGKLSVKDVKEFLAGKGVSVRCGELK
ncbi:imidazole glycerol phosphate synthase subunit HisF [Candidatus Micrarchaeota archaeon CG1_02_55_22]|nr:MAG: imidazole glycerol phosphate synthase subunit HisF [Candidatus Micrarchaeota archaeon CG1_02_55_22]